MEDKFFGVAWIFGHRFVILVKIVGVPVMDVIGESPKKIAKRHRFYGFHEKMRRDDDERITRFIGKIRLYRVAGNS